MGMSSLLTQSNGARNPYDEIQIPDFPSSSTSSSYNLEGVTTVIVVVDVFSLICCSNTMGKKRNTIVNLWKVWRSCLE
jgi:hypothetical protein